MIKKLIVLLAFSFVSVLVLVFVVVSLSIGREVSEQCQVAQGGYDGDCVEALMMLVDDEENSFRSRNSAVWALGQLGDKRALSVLEKHFTGVIPDREPLDQVLSQYELEKAINLLKGGLNISAFVWRLE